MGAPPRPSSVPPEAEYFDDWKEWGVGERAAGNVVGPWRLSPAHGTFVEESHWVDGKCHGEKRRFHDDGALASVAQYRDDVMGDIVQYRTRGKTREPNYDDLPASIAVLEFPRR